MHTRCPRCQLDLDAASPWVQCPRCGTPFAAAPPPPAQYPSPQQQPPQYQAPQFQPPQQPRVPPTQPSAQAQFVPSTQAVDPAMLAQVMRASSSAPAQAQAPQVPAYQPTYAPAPRPGFVADEDLAGSAVLSVVLSIVALLGGCNPVGLVGITVGLMAYAAANDRRVDLARARGRTARRFAWAAMVITAIVWVVVVLSLFYEF